MTRLQNGWDVEVLQNSWLRLSAAPQLGGRLMQLALDGYPYLFVNPRLAGYRPDATRLGKSGAWLNYGGEKIWPAPQGWDSPDQWPGPPDPVLDGGAYGCAAFQPANGHPGLRLTSPFDPNTGLRIERDVWLSSHRAEVNVAVRFHNASQRSRRWSVWPVCQVDASGWETGACRVVCPVNPKSRFEGGYRVLHGLVNNPQYQIDAWGNLVVAYQYLVGKVGLDASAGWVGFVHQHRGKVLVMRYDYEAGKPYPDGTSVHVWTQGRGQIYSRNRLAEFANDPLTNPPYVELELLSPLASIPPGDSHTFGYRLQACTIPPGESLVTTTDVGVVARRLTATRGENELLISGKYGVFGGGWLTLGAADSSVSTGTASRVLSRWPVSPTAGVEVVWVLSDDFWLSGKETTLSLDLWTEGGRWQGRLDQLTLPAPGQPVRSGSV